MRATYLGEGYDSTAFEVNAGWVFRFPKRQDVERQLFIERTILPFLAGRTSVPLPAFSFHGMPSGLFPRHFAGYPRLPGVPAIGVDPAAMDPVELAPVLAEFLWSIHGFPVETAVALGVPEHAPGLRVGEAGDEARVDLERVGEMIPDAPEESWRAFFEQVPDTTGVEPTLVHGDLAAEHVLIDPDGPSVTGIIDWSEASVADPAVDFAGLCHWGGRKLAEAVLAGAPHRYDGRLLDRACYLGACRGVADIVFGWDTGRPEYIRAGTRALRFCTG